MNKWKILSIIMFVSYVIVIICLQFLPPYPDISYTKEELVFRNISSIAYTIGMLIAHIGFLTFTWRNKND